MKTLNEYLITEAVKVTNIVKKDMYVLIAYGDDLVDEKENDINGLIGIYTFNQLVDLQIEDGLLISDYLEDYEKELNKIKSLNVGEEVTVEGDYSCYKIIKVS